MLWGDDNYLKGWLQGHEEDGLRHAAEENVRLIAALQSAIRIANEAREEWDKAPSGMRAGKILIALAGGCPGYRADIDAIHAVIAKAIGE